MPWIAAAVGGGASLLGGMMQGDAAGDAAETQAGATDRANAIQEKQYNQTRTDLAGYRQYGNAATNELARRMGFGYAGGPGGGQMLVDSSSGVPKRNEFLYNSSPEYRSAWDDAAAQHRAAYGVN